MSWLCYVFIQLYNCVGNNFCVSAHFSELYTHLRIFIVVENHNLEYELSFWKFLISI